MSLRSGFTRRMVFGQVLAQGGDYLGIISRVGNDGFGSGWAWGSSNGSRSGGKWCGMRRR